MKIESPVSILRLRSQAFIKPSQGADRLDPTEQVSFKFIYGRMIGGETFEEYYPAGIFMTISLITTKFYIPAVRPDQVHRPRLIESLDEGLHRKLTLISAPAGFGKTTLISEWVGGLRSQNLEGNQLENCVAWLSLDDGDNDSVRFLTYIVEALNQTEGMGSGLGEGIVGMLQTPQPPPTEAILTSLINALADTPGRTILVLDDYQLIESLPIDDALTFLIEHLPPQIHLVIATREDPNFPLSRLRARDQLTEIRAADLRFTTSEAADFLNHVMGLALSSEDIATLETRTEGWIAGLQLAAISMRGSDDVTAFINSFTGSQRFVLDYLIEEVLDQQSESLQTFLLLTAILDRLNGALCDTLTGGDNGQETLETLERVNLFIVPLDGEREWYRYHHLFADLLRQRLSQTQQEQIPFLHQRASEWYENNGFTDDAVEHALHVEDYERAARLIDEHVDVLWGRVGHSKLQRWLGELPEEILFSRPFSSIFQARYQCNLGQLDAAERTLQAAERVLDGSTPEIKSQKQLTFTDTDRVKLRGRIAATRALLCSYQGDVPGIIQHASQALENLPEEDLTWRALTALVLGNAHGFKGDMNAAYDARVQALCASQAAGDSYLIIVANLSVAITVRDQGLLQETIEICQQQLEIANKHGLSQTSIAGYLLAVWGETLAELNELNAAFERAEQGFNLTKPRWNREMLGWSYICFVRVLFSKGDLVGVEKITEEMQEIGRESYLPPWITNQVTAWQARLWLKQNKLELAIGWAEDRGLKLDGEPLAHLEIDFFSLFDYLLLARVLIAQERMEESSTLLQQLLKTAEAGGRLSKVIEILVLQALSPQAGGNTTHAMNSLKRALALAEPGGFIRIFLDEGQPIVPLLHEAGKRGIAPEYVRRLLAAFPSEGLDQATKTLGPDQSVLIETLSERELEVLQCIAEGLTNREIAERLYLSLNTVKVHTRNIFGKLGVNNRTLAVARARELGVFPSTYGSIVMGTISDI